MAEQVELTVPTGQDPGGQPGDREPGGPTIPTPSTTRERRPAAARGLRDWRRTSFAESSAVIRNAAEILRAPG